MCRYFFVCGVGCAVMALVSFGFVVFNPSNATLALLHLRDAAAFALAAFALTGVAALVYK